MGSRRSSSAPCAAGARFTDSGSGRLRSGRPASGGWLVGHRAKRRREGNVYRPLFLRPAAQSVAHPRKTPPSRTAHSALRPGYRYGIRTPVSGLKIRHPDGNSGWRWYHRGTTATSGAMIRKTKRLRFRGLLYSGGGIRTRDLRVMRRLQIGLPASLVPVRWSPVPRDPARFTQFGTTVGTTSDHTTWTNDGPACALDAGGAGAAC